MWDDSNCCISISLLWQNTREYQLKVLFWLMVLEVSVHTHLTPLLWAFDRAEYHGRDCMVEQSCSSHDGQEAEKER
jgi:hypothetical protein